MRPVVPANPGNTVALCYQNLDFNSQIWKSGPERSDEPLNRIVPTGVTLRAVRHVGL